MLVLASAWDSGPAVSVALAWLMAPWKDDGAVSSVLAGLTPVPDALSKLLTLSDIH